MRPCLALLAAVSCTAARGATFVLPPDDVDLVGSVESVTARYEDTLPDLGRVHGLGYEDMVRANPGIDPWLPGEGTEVTLPTRFVLPPGPREGIVINLAEYRLYYYPPPRRGEPPTVETYPISIGRLDWATPLGLHRIQSKVRDPAWYPPASVREEAREDGREMPRIVPPGPENPLGRFAMALDIPGYLIHGTNRPLGVGMRVTHGCIRMFPEDIEALFPTVPVGTPVRVINEPVKIGWLAGELYLEVHPPLEEELPDPDTALRDLADLLGRTGDTYAFRMDWRTSRSALAEATGFPVTISDGPRQPRAAGGAPASAGARSAPGSASTIP